MRRWRKRACWAHATRKRQSGSASRGDFTRCTRGVHEGESPEVPKVAAEVLVEEISKLALCVRGERSARGAGKGAPR